jgi:hypothetical protein
VGVKAEVEKSRQARIAEGESEDVDMGEDINATGEGQGRNEWLEVAIDVPGLRDDDALPVFLGAMLSEALCADSGLKDRLWINARFHWRLYVDVSFAVGERNFYRRGHRLLTRAFLDPPPFATSFLPAASAESDHTSRSAQHAPPGSALPRRRGSAIQRRLGSFHIPLPAPIKELANPTPIPTANHAPSNHSRA